MIPHIINAQNNTKIEGSPEKAKKNTSNVLQHKSK